MHVMECNGFGGPEVFRWKERTTPLAAADEVLIKVVAAGVNRADISQRQGKYPPPPGASDIIGMEVSGVVQSVGKDVDRWKVGDKLCALLPGGGYAEYAVATAAHCLPVPPNISLMEAGALPEAVITAFANIFEAGQLQHGETLLIHGGSSGIGTIAIQMAKACGAKVIVTVGNDQKAEVCRRLGADLAINYKAEDFVEAVQADTGGQGVDVILDMVGGDYVARNLSILAARGRHVSIATQGGAQAAIDLRILMQKRLTLTGSTLRSRSKEEKARLIGEVESLIWPLVASGKVKPVIEQIVALRNVAEAHKLMESGTHIGKIILEAGG